MVERYLIVDQLKYSYEGLFNVEEIYTIITGFFYEKGWDFYEKMNQEMLTPSGKQIRIQLEPWKNISDYHGIRMRIKLTFTDVQEVDIKNKGQNLRLSQGLMRLVIDAYVTADRKNKWSDKIYYWVFSILMDKFFLKSQFDKAKDWIESDVSGLYEKIKVHINSFNYKYKNKLEE